MKDMIMKPKIWLVLIAVMHSVVGIIVPVIQMGGNKDDLAIVLYFLLVSVYLIYAAFMIEGKNQARMAVVLCAPVVVWFIISGIMRLEMMGAPVAELPSALVPLILWGLPTITGILNWNID